MCGSREEDKRGFISTLETEAALEGMKQKACGEEQHKPGAIGWESPVIWKCKKGASRFVAQSVLQKENHIVKVIYRSDANQTSSVQRIHAI